MAYPRVMKNMFRAALLALLLLCGCERTVLISGRVTDVRGVALPGVAVTVGDADYEGLTDGTGEYRIRCEPGTVSLHFIKTGYTPGHMELRAGLREGGAGAEDADTPLRFSKIQAREVMLWPLPPAKGVYLFEDFAYRALTRCEVAKYLARMEKAEEDSGGKAEDRIRAARFVHGTEIGPEVEMVFEAPAGEAVSVLPAAGEIDAGRPLIIACRMPPWDVHLCRMKEVEAARIYPEMTPEDIQDLVYARRVWVEEENVPVLTAPVDEPDRLLVELRSPVMLTPGVWAVHWGALNGHTSTDPRIFMFRVTAPGPENTPADTSEDEGESETNQDAAESGAASEG
jgi:hypothetical protein